MKTPKVYLETTVFNYVFADDSPKEKSHTLKLFEEIRAGLYEPYTSGFVLDELAAAPEPKRSEMIALVKAYGVKVLPANNEAARLASLYIAEGIIPEKNIVDASHIAMTTVNNLDFIVSLNFRHIVRRKTIMLTEVVNLREGYHRIGLFSPTEVIEHE